MGLTEEIIPAVTESYDNGAPKKIEYHRKMGKKIILTKIEVYYENGQMKSEKNYGNKYLNSKWIYYNNDGTIKEEKKHPTNFYWDRYNQPMMMEYN